MSLLTFLVFPPLPSLDPRVAGIVRWLIPCIAMETTIVYYCTYSTISIVHMNTLSQTGSKILTLKMFM